MLGSRQAIVVGNLSLVLGRKLIVCRPCRCDGRFIVHGYRRLLGQCGDHILHLLPSGRVLLRLGDGEAVDERGASALDLVCLVVQMVSVDRDARVRRHRQVERNRAGNARRRRLHVVLHAAGTSDDERRAVGVERRFVVAPLVGLRFRRNLLLGAAHQKRRAVVHVIVAGEHEVDIACRRERIHLRTDGKHIGIVLMRSVRIGGFVHEHDLPLRARVCKHVVGPVVLGLGKRVVGVEIVGVEHYERGVLVHIGVVHARREILP